MGGLSKTGRRMALAVAALVLAATAAASTIYCWYSHGRGLEQEIARLAFLCEMQSGTTVAEIGAGQGRMSIRLSRRLGSLSRFYVTEIDGDKLNAIRRAAAGLPNFVVLQAGEHSSNLPEACCDVVFMRRVYHHLAGAAAINQSIYSALRPGGRMVVIDFISPRWLFWMRHGIAADVVTGQVAAAGFNLERRIDRWSPIDYCLMFRKREQR